MSGYRIVFTSRNLLALLVMKFILVAIVFHGYYVEHPLSTSNIASFVGCQRLFGVGEWNSKMF